MLLLLIYQMNLPFMLIDYHYRLSYTLLIYRFSLLLLLIYQMSLPFLLIDYQPVYLCTCLELIYPVKDEVDVISKYSPLNVFAATITLPPTISLGAPMFLAPTISQLFINRCVCIVNPVLAFELTLNRGKLILSLNSNVDAPLIVSFSSPDDSLHVIDDKLIVLAVIVPVKVDLM